MSRLVPFDLPRLETHARPQICAAPNAFVLTIRHGGVTPPTATRGAAPARGRTPAVAAVGTDDLYESTLTIRGPATDSFRCSIYPDDLSERGRLADGTYPLYLGFHKRNGATPTAADLVARTNGFRAALVVSNDASVPVVSSNPAKTTATAIHVHNGFKTRRYSDGCPTLHPDDWSRFIEFFIAVYPLFSTWTSTSRYVGVQVGSLVVAQ